MRCIAKAPSLLIFCFFLALTFISACCEKSSQKIGTEIGTNLLSNLALNSVSSDTVYSEIHVKILKGKKINFIGDKDEIKSEDIEAAISGLKEYKIIKVNTIYDHHQRLLVAEIWYCDK